MISWKDILLRSLMIAAAVAGVMALTEPCAAQDVSEPTDQSAETATSEEAEGEMEHGQSSVKLGARPGVFAELHIRDADIRRALEMINVQARKNIVTTKEVTGKVTADLYRVTFREVLDAILRANGYVYVERGNFIYVMTAEQQKKLAQAQRKTDVKMFRLSYITATDARTLITPLLSADGSVAITPAAEVGIASCNNSAGGNAYATEDVIMVKDYEENLRRIAAEIRKLDVKPDQVLIEATLLRAILDEDNHLGVDLNLLTGVNFNTLSATTTKMGSVTLGTVSANFKRYASSFRTDFTSAVPQGGLSFGLLGNHVGAFIRALESVTDTTVMANPKLLIINKQRGEVFVGSEDGYLTTTFTETTASQTVEMLKTGTRLIVRPFIGRDNYVRLEIHPEDSSGSVSQVGESALPSKTTTEVTSNVLVRDGHTIVIGGLFREETKTTRSQTPLIGNIPYLGDLFRSNKDSTDREEVIILLTPRIARQDTDEIVSEQLKDDIERFRIGHRKGLRWWGRDRMANTHLRWARNALAKGKEGLALWNVDMALSIQPRMAEAFQLKERLTNKALWADETRHSAAKYIIQKMIMSEMGKPVEPVIPPAKPRRGDVLDEEVKRALGIGVSPELPLGSTPRRNKAPKPVVPQQSKSKTDDKAATPPAASVTP